MVVGMVMVVRATVVVVLVRTLDVAGSRVSHSGNLADPGISLLHFP
jgi:hypothetical protein